MTTEAEVERLRVHADYLRRQGRGELARILDDVLDDADTLAGYDPQEVDHARRAGRWRGVAYVLLAQIIGGTASTATAAEVRQAARALVLDRDADLIDVLVADWLTQHRP